MTDLTRGLRKFSPTSERDEFDYLLTQLGIPLEHTNRNDSQEELVAEVRTFWPTWRRRRISPLNKLVLTNSPVTLSDGTKTTALRALIEEGIVSTATEPVVLYRFSISGVGKLNALKGQNLTNEILEAVSKRIISNLGYLNPENVDDQVSMLQEFDGTGVIVMLTGGLGRTDPFEEADWAVTVEMTRATDNFDLPEGISGIESKEIELGPNDITGTVLEEIRGLAEFPKEVILVADTDFDKFIIEEGLISQQTWNESGGLASELHSDGINKSFEGNFRTEEKELTVRLDKLAQKAGKILTPKKLEDLYNRQAAPALDSITDSFGRMDRYPIFKAALDQVPKNGLAVYFELDVSNLGELNRVIGYENADYVFAEFATIARLAFEKAGFDLLMFRHGGDEFSFIGYIPAEKASDYQQVVRSVQLLIEKRANQIRYSEDGSNVEKPLSGVVHPKNEDRETPIRNNGTGVNIVASVLTDENIETIEGVVAEEMEDLKDDLDNSVSFLDDGQANSASSGIGGKPKQYTPLDLGSLHRPGSLPTGLTSRTSPVGRW